MTIRYASLVCFSIAVLLAQDPYGRITGRIVDSAGAVVPGAHLSVANIETNVVTRVASDSQGNYEARNLIPGQYKVAVEMQGFKRYERGPVELRVGDVATVDVGLELGALSESVTVTAEASLLDASNASVGQVIDRRRLEDLPMPSSAAMYLTQLVPGVLSTNPPSGNWQNNQPEQTSNFSANGTRTRTSEMMIDGTPNMYGYGTVFYQVPPEMLQEFRVQTAPFDASVGHFVGAQVNMVTKSGTNSLHGILVYQHNSRPLLTHPFFTNQWIYDTSTGPVTRDKMNQAFPPTRMNRYRATAGGPVYLPKLYNGRNRTFFTYGMDRFTRDFVIGVYSMTVPTIPQRTGNFSALLALGARYQIYDPNTITAVAGGRTNRLPLANNIVPASRMDAAAKRLLEYFPLPNAPGTADGLNNFSSNPMNHPKNYSYIFRVDHVISSNHRLFVSFRRMIEDTRGSGARRWPEPLLGQTNAALANSVTLDDVIILRPNLVLNMRYGLNRVGVEVHPASLGFDLTSLGLPASLAGQLDGSLTALPDLNIAGLSRVGTDSGRRYQQNYHFFAGTMAHSRGNHSLRFGGEFRVYQENPEVYGYIAPAYTFSTNWTRGPLDTSPAAPAGQGLASFLLGLPTGGQINRNASAAQQSEYLGLFLQDDWKVSRKLTINLGLRYELELPTTERFNRANWGFGFSTANPIQAAAQAAYALSPIPEIPVSQFRTVGGLLFAGVNGAPRGLWRTDTRNFAPRVGLAYHLQAKTVLRAGYGVFFDSLGVDRFDVLQQGFSQTTNLTPSLDNGLTFYAKLANPFPGGLLAPAGTSAGLKTFLGLPVSLFWPDRKPGYMQRWSLGLQRELPNRVVVEVAYVGNRGTGLDMSQDLNPVPAQYLSRSPVRDQTTINYLSAAVANPFDGMPEFAGTNLQGRTVGRSQLLSPYPHFAGVSTTLSAGFSWYHALQVRAEKRFSRGFTLQASYTWSKFMEATDKLNPTDAFPAHAISDLDRPQHIVVSGMYELPIGKGKRLLSAAPGWVHGTLGGWSIQAIFHGQSGPPGAFGNIIFNGNLAGIVLPRSERKVERWFNTSAGFERDSQKQLGANIRTFPQRLTGLRSNGYNSWDFSLFKGFRITEKLTFQLRAEAQDALNHPMFAAPDTNPVSTSFGQVTNTLIAQQRVVTVGARLSW